MILVTGGAGFIGANFVLDWIAEGNGSVLNLDKLSYAGNLNNLISLKKNPNHIFVQGDILDRRLINELLHKHKPTAILNFAAETHVDRSIVEPEAFILTNIVGTYSLLEEALDYWKSLDEKQKNE